MSNPVWLTNLIETATGTVVGDKQALDVFVTGGVLSFTETATSPDGGPPPDVVKVVAGVGDDGLVHTVHTDNSGNVYVAQSGIWNINDITGTVSLPTGAATEATLDSIDSKTHESIVSIVNSTTTPLGSAGTFTGAGEDVTQYAAILTSIVTDRAGTFYAENSNDGIFWDETKFYAITPDTPGTPQAFTFSFIPEGQFARVRYINGGTAQGVFDLQTIFNVEGQGGEIHPVSIPIRDRTEALVTKGVIYGKTTGGGGGYVSVKVTPSGALAVDISGSTVIITGVVNTSEQGFTRANAPTRNDYLVTPVTTAAYVQLVASTSSATKEIEIFDSSGQTLVLATGAAAAEVDQMLIFPGGNGRVKLAIPASTRVSIKAVSSTANVGEISVNWYG